MKNVVVVYHDNCLDGLMAAKVAYDHLGDNADYIAGKYDEVPSLEIVPFLEIFENKIVYLLDFSFKRDYFLKLKEVAKEVIVLDHHKTAHEEIGDLCVINQHYSGAALAWYHFNSASDDTGNVELPIEVALIQDRDLWKFEFEETKAYTMALHSNKGNDLFEFMDYLKNNTTEQIIKLGNILLDLHSKELAELLKGAYLANFNKWVVPFLNAPAKFASDAGNILSKYYPFAVIYFDKGNKRYFSLRSNEQGEDVSVIAKAHGGGGHVNAAGFTLNDVSYGVISTHVKYDL